MNKSKYDYIKYIVITYLSTLLNVILNMLLMSMLSVFDFGRVSLGKSMYQSFEYSHLGVRYGLDRLLPHSDETDRNMFFTSAVIFTFCSSFLFTLFWFFYGYSNFDFYCYFCVSGVLYSVFTIYKVYYRAFEDKRKFVGCSFWIMIFPISVQLIGLYLGDIKGFLISMLIGHIISITVCLKYYDVTLVRNKYFLIKSCKKLFSVGYLLFISSMVSFFSVIGDRFFIADYWGVDAVGIYAVIMFFFSALTIFSTGYAELIMNQIMLQPKFRNIIKHLFILILINIILVLITYFILPYFINSFLLKYSDYIELIILISMGVIPYGILPILNSYHHAIDKRKVLLAIQLICNTLYFIGLLVILNCKYKLENLIYLKLGFICLLVFMMLGSFMYFSKISSNKCI